MKSKYMTTGLLVFYLAVLSWIIIFKMAFSAEQLPHLRIVNLIPFGESVIINGKLHFGELIQNLLAFVPYGILLHTLWEDKSLFKQLLPIICTSLIFEVIQYVFSVGASDITDVIMNSAGGIVGIGVAIVIAKLSKEHRVQIINIVSLTGAVLLGGLIAMLILANL